MGGYYVKAAQTICGMGWLPDAYEGHGTWLQDVGSFKVSYQPAEIMAAFEQKISLEASRFKPEASTLGAKAA